MDETLPGVFVAVVGADSAAVQRYADRALTHLTDAGWIARGEAHDVGESRDDDAEPEALRTLAELSDIVARRIRPVLEAGEVVVCAGYRDPIVVRFGVHAGLGPERVLRMAHWSSGDLVPDLFLLVDDAGDEGAAYRELAAAAPERYLWVTPLIDGGDLPEDVSDQVAGVLRKHSPRRRDETAVSENDEVPADDGVPVGGVMRGSSAGPGNGGTPVLSGDEEPENSVIPDSIR
jgi:hypothetical protein